LRLEGDRLAAVEQDTDTDVESCIVAVLSYPKGWRFDSPGFGRPDVTFKQGGVDVAALTRAVNDSEPRATPHTVAGALSHGIQHVTVDPGVATGRRISTTAGAPPADEPVPSGLFPSDELFPADELFPD